MDHRIARGTHERLTGVAAPIVRERYRAAHGAHRARPAHDPHARLPGHHRERAIHRDESDDERPGPRHRRVGARSRVWALSKGETAPGTTGALADPLPSPVPSTYD